MKILHVQALAIPDIKVVTFGRFCDHRGYFTETWRKSDLETHKATTFLRGFEFLQCNESYSRAGTVRGLHFQWNPYMGKFIRTIYGRMVDLVLDIRLDSPYFGKIIAHDMPAHPANDSNAWIWVPPGFAHGNFFTEETVIEYFCSGSYNPQCEAGISPLTTDLDWSLADPELKRLFQETLPHALMTEKDRQGFTLQAWKANPLSQNFRYGKSGT